MRLTIGPKNEFKFVDVPFKGAATVNPCSKAFADAPIFAEHRQEVDDIFKSELDDSKQSNGFLPSLVQIAQESNRYVAFMTRIDQQDKYFKIYDAHSKTFTRKLSHKNIDDEAFAFNGTLLARVEGKSI